MENLRLILILIGLVVLALIVLLHRPEGESKRNHTRWRSARREPTLGDPDGEPVDPGGENATGDIGGHDTPENASLWPAAGESSNETAGEHVARAEPTAHESPDKIVYLYISRRGDQRISGSELLDAAIKAGLNFGEMNIFHRRHEGAKNPVFSMANLTPPGHFDPSQWNVFDTPGVTLFLTLPAPVSALDAWDAMLATAERISQLLEADVLDDAKCLLTRQRIAQIREEMREYDRQSGMIKPE
ncbi:MULTISPECIES: cell division protein ZipA [unclassified Wenzhouxiangella]|uniref:cell division protein ZipA n=1 Tax=unclassified Wenzhouxiangella TaxID=2613841 RepID=UPI000E32CB5F|nr:MULTISPECIES: cell division protein ZipA [unclassified Wenzhouxiangella]RFF27980.1 cell division protein ZipA [Wenzhouxiangella sp. 15181]RFP68567.1 cell division protein ZipA [Wenzhouxiangella sp. 15190]